MCIFGICIVMTIKLCTYKLVFVKVCRCLWLWYSKCHCLVYAYSEYMYVLNWCCKGYLVVGGKTYIPAGVWCLGARVPKRLMAILERVRVPGLPSCAIPLLGPQPRGLICQAMDCNSNLGHEYILSGLQNSFMNYLLLTHTTFIRLLEAVFLVNVITHTDTVAISAWPSWYKKWCRPFSTRVVTLSIENSWSGQTKLLFPQQLYGWQKFCQFEECLMIHRKNWI